MVKKISTNLYDVSSLSMVLVSNSNFRKFFKLKIQNSPRLTPHFLLPFLFSRSITQLNWRFIIVLHCLKTHRFHWLVSDLYRLKVGSGSCRDCVLILGIEQVGTQRTVFDVLSCCGFWSIRLKLTPVCLRHQSSWCYFLEIECVDRTTKTCEMLCFGMVYVVKFELS